MEEKMVTLIPAKKKTADRKSNLVRVAAYARVSSLPQEESYDSQVKHFTSLISGHPNWKLIHVYGDEGISGLNTKKRDGFKLMIKDGKRRKYDLLLVKSISRMGRNTVDLLNALRELKAAGVSIFFEKENINTGETTGEMLITLLSAFAQSESESISANVRIGLQYKMARGEHSLAYSNFLGYDKGENGKLVINPEQAKTVRFIFDSFLSGMTLIDLTKALEEGGHLTGAGNLHWTKMGIRRILCNEKMCGCALLGKTTVVDVLNKVREENTGQAPKYFVENDHEPIVDMQTYLLAKGELIRRSHKCVEGPSLVPRINDYSGKIRCPLCGRNYNHKWAKSGYRWICNGRINSDCNAPIIKEERLNEATLEALQKLWDSKPVVDLLEVPILKMHEEDNVLEQAAIAYMKNLFAKRVSDFCAGERPTCYDPETTRNLIERISIEKDEITYHFYGVR